MSDCATPLTTSFPPALLDTIVPALAPIDPGPRAPACLVGVAKAGERHVLPLGRVHDASPERNVVLEWGSITKTVTAVLLARASVDGHLSLDEPLHLVLEEAAHMPP